MEQDWLLFSLMLHQSEPRSHRISHVDERGRDTRFELEFGAMNQGSIGKAEDCVKESEYRIHSLMNVGEDGRHPSRPAEGALPQRLF